MSVLASSPRSAASFPRDVSTDSSRSGHILRRIGTVFLLLLLCGTLFFYGLNTGQLYQTESLRAILAAEFPPSGNLKLRFITATILTCSRRKSTRDPAMLWEIFRKRSRT